MILTHHEQALLLLRFLQQRQRKAELEQTLVLAEAQGSPLVFCRGSIFFLEEETESRRAGCGVGN